MPTPSSDPDEVEQHVATAHEIHSKLDSFKHWAIKQQADLLAKAEVADEIDHRNTETIPADGDTLREAAAKIQTVYERIEEGDRTRVRNGGSRD